VDEIGAYAMEASHPLMMGIGAWGPIHKSAENSAIFTHSRCADIDLRALAARSVASSRTRNAGLRIVTLTNVQVRVGMSLTKGAYLF
jgi:hypothetical protein